MAASSRGWRWPWMLHHRLLDAVEILAAVDVDQRAALGPLDDQRLVLGHLREGVPDERAVPALEFLAGRFGWRIGSAWRIGFSIGGGCSR